MKLLLERRWGRVVVAAFALEYIFLLAYVVEFPTGYTKAQTSRAPELIALLCDEPAQALACPDADTIVAATRRDHVFAVGYVVLGAIIVLCLAGLRTWTGRATRTAAWGWLAVGLLFAGGLADIVENETLHRSATRLSTLGSSDTALVVLGDLPDRTVLAAMLKWALLAGAAALTIWSVFGPPGVHARPHPVYNRPPRDDDRPWDPPPATEERLGICCSGGGIRSAAFSLGALQALRAHPGDKPLLPRARYLSAVSGGGYLAAGLVVAEGTVKVEPGHPAVFAPGSAEERHFRDHSSYLVPDVKKGAVGIGRLLLGLVLNLALVWLVLFLLGRPIGWAIGGLHPELRAHQPVALTRDPIPALRAVSVRQVACTTGAECDTPEGRRADSVYEVVLTNVDEDHERGRAAKDEETAAVLLDVAPFHPRDAFAECSYTVTDQREGAARRTARPPRRSREEDAEATARRALVAVTDGRAEVVRQPVVEPLVPLRDGEPCAGLAHTLEVERQPTLGLRDAAVAAPEDLLAELVVTTQARVTSATGLRGRDDITVDGTMWRTVRNTTGAALGFGLLLVILRPSGSVDLPGVRKRVTTWWPKPDDPRRRLLRHLARRRNWFAWPATVAAVAAVGLFLLLVALPWLVQELPAALASWAGELDRAVGSAGSGLQDYLVPGGGALFLAVTALRRYLAGAPDTDDGRKKTDSPGPLRRAWRWLSGRSRQLSWYELSPAKVLLAVVLTLSTVVLFVLHLQYASANGPGGRLMGVAFVRDKVGDFWWRPEWQRYAAVLAGLLLFERFVDAHAWSLQPFYKRRLSWAFLEGRRQKKRYDDGPVRFDEAQPPLNRFPQLIVGCAVNLSEVGRVPPGRRAASFTFSSTEIGGPLVGYVPTATYWDAMRRARQKDITVPGAMAISGAAFSPAMGKFNLGPVGAMMALANLRLGVWLPHPQYVAPSPPRSWIHRPGWSWFLREVLNRYRFDEPYLYVSDGGHWENLGLVELLRRGCTKIVCINAGGDSQHSFGTIGEAIALAREELNVEFYDFDPSPLRPPVKAAEGGRQLRRAVARDKPEPLATASFVVGKFRYRSREDREGRIWLVEPALTADLPFDVHVFAESEAIFPDDSTGDQVFNHRQFESFRALGYHQACKVASDPVFLE